MFKIDGASGQVLTTNGAGQVTWQDTGNLQTWWERDDPFLSPKSSSDIIQLGSNYTYFGEIASLNNFYLSSKGYYHIGSDVWKSTSVGSGWLMQASNNTPSFRFYAADTPAIGSSITWIEKFGIFDNRVRTLNAMKVGPDAGTAGTSILVDVRDYGRDFSSLTNYLYYGRQDMYDNSTTISGNTTQYGIYNYNRNYSTQSTDISGTRFLQYGLYNYTRQEASSKCYIQYGIYNYVYSNTTANSAHVAYKYGNYTNMYQLNDAGWTGVYGDYILISNQGTAQITTAWGNYVHINQDDLGGEITTSYCYYAYQNRDNGTSTNAYLYYGNYAGTHTFKYGIWLVNCIESFIDGELRTDTLGLTEVSAPGTPPSGRGRLWVNTSGILKFTNDAGTTTDLT